MRQAALYPEGLPGAAKRKNGRRLARQRGDARPWRTQRVLSHVLWDETRPGTCATGTCSSTSTRRTGFLKKGEH